MSTTTKKELIDRIAENTQARRSLAKVHLRCRKNWHKSVFGDQFREIRVVAPSRPE